MPSAKGRYFSSGSEDEGPSFERRKRRKVLDIERIENLLTTLKNNPEQSMESNLEYAATFIVPKLDTCKERVVEVLISCALQAPEHLADYATLAGLVNAKDFSFGNELITQLSKDLLQNVKKCEFVVAFIIVLLCCHLVTSRCISAQSCFLLLKSFIGTCAEEKNFQLRTDWYVYVALNGLVLIGKELSEIEESSDMDLSAMLDAIEKYISSRKTEYLPLLKVWTSDEPHLQEEYLECLWAQVKNLRDDKWQTDYVSRPQLAFDAALSDAVQHDLPPFVPPPAHRSEITRYPLPRVVFRMFDMNDCVEEGSSLPEPHCIDRYLVEQYLTWILRKYNQNRKECAATLLQYPKKDTVALHYVILEVIFGQVFRLPLPPYVELFYGSLMIELCKLQPNSMPQVLAQAAEVLYQRLDTMQVQCIDRFIDWFSYHLSNFQFRWSWEEWADCLPLSRLSPKQQFVREVLLECMRFSFHQRVLDIMPSSFTPLVPARPTPLYKYSEEGSQNLPGTSIAHHLAQALRNRCSADEVLFILKDCPNPYKQSDSDSYNPLKVDVLVLTILDFGSKSPSHTFVALSKYQHALRTLTEGDQRLQLCVLKCVFQFWSTNHKMIEIIVDKLLKMRIIDCSTIIQWVFCEEMREELLKYYVWRIVMHTLNNFSEEVEKERIESGDSDGASIGGKSKKNADTSGNTDTEVEDTKDTQTTPKTDTRLQCLEEMQKNVFLMIFQKFIILIMEHLLKTEASNDPEDAQWLFWIAGRLRLVFLSRYNDIFKYTDALRSVLFTNDIDPYLVQIFEQFYSLRQ